MPLIKRATTKRHPDNTPLVRFSANVRPETRDKLGEYAQKKKMSIALALDILVESGIDADGKLHESTS